MLVRALPYVMFGFLCAFALPAGVAASERLTPYTWEDTLNLPKVRFLIKESFETRKEAPNDFALADRLLRLCSYAWRLEKDNPKQRMEYAKCLYQVGNETIEAHPEHPAGYLGAAMGLGGMALIRGVLASLQHVPQGKKLLEKSVELDPNFHCSLAISLIGRAYSVVPSFPMSIGDRRKAVENLKHARELCPNNSLAVLSMADLAWSLRKNDEVLAILKQLDVITPSSEIEHFLLQVCRRKAAELAELVKGGAERDPFFDILSDTSQGLVGLR